MNLLNVVLAIHSPVRWVIAAVGAHVSMRWRKADVPIGARNNVALIVGVPVIVFIGISMLPQGWTG